MYGVEYGVKYGVFVRGTRQILCILCQPTYGTCPLGSRVGTMGDLHHASYSLTCR